jgi:DNA polymerase-3 subunit alpha
LNTEDFTHLHLHTQYSFLDGAIRMGDLVKKVDELGMKQVAVTDHGNMFGAVDFFQKATKAGIKPIIGMEAYVTGKAKHTEKIRENFHLVLLAENDVGYDNLKKLSSKAFVDGKYYYPRIDKELLKEHNEGIIGLTACLGGEVGKKCAKGDLDGAREVARNFKDIFGKDNFFLEVQPNGIDIQNKVNADLAQLSQDEGIPLIATNDCHYVTQDQHEAQNILMAIRQQKAWDDPNLHKHEVDAFYIRSPQEMYSLLKSDYEEAFANACRVGARCNVKLDLGNTYLPPFPFPEKYSDESDYLRHLSREGLKKRFSEVTYPVDQEEYFARLDLELDIIIQMGFPGYFLIVQDFINWAKQNSVRVGPGRGSGAGSLVAYALRITDIDPIPYNLLFERFLNPERVSMPDFDVDFMQERRGKVIQYVAEKYGRDHVGQIATYAGLNPKSAIKDVARTLGVPFGEINELTKPMPLLVDGKKPNLDQSLEYAPRLKEKAATEPKYKKIVEVAKVLEGLYRQAGMHAGGVVIGEKPLVDYVPIFSGANGELVTQFDKDKVEAAGLVKFDFLGLKTLDVIEQAERLVNERIAWENELSGDDLENAAGLHPHTRHPHGEAIEARKAGEKIVPLDVSLLAPDNKEVYRLIASGDTLGVFQVESTGFQELCRKLKPDNFEDIVAAVALYRPGPMQSGMVDDFIDRKHGRKAVRYPHPLLEQVLEPTYGTIVYQEQVMQSAQVLAGYTLGGADILRRAMGKKKFEEMNRQRQIFVEGAEKNGVDKEQAAEIFDTIEKFAGYGFNKSHSAAYALITYQTAYLKRFYPVEFMAALLTTEAGSTDNVVKYIHHAKTAGISVLPPNINVSERSFTVDYDVDEKTRNRRKKRHTAYAQVRFGLGAVKGLGDAALEAILDTRRQKGAFKSIFHFCEQVPVQKINKKVLEVLTKSGAMDGFGQNRNQLFASIEKAMDSASGLQKDARVGQANMFGIFAEQGEGSGMEETYPDLAEWPEKELLAFERESIGFYLSGHPLDRYADDAKRLGTLPTVDLVTQNHNSEAQVVGIVATLRERMLKSGDGRWAVVTLEDNFGQCEVLAFSRVYEEAEMLLKSGEPLLIKGRALLDDIDDEGKQRTPKMRAEAVESLADAQIARTRILDVKVEVPANGNGETEKWVEGLPENDAFDKEAADKLLNSLQATFKNYPGDKPVRVHLSMPSGYRVTIRCGDEMKVHPTEELLMDLERVKGVEKVTRV